MTDVLDTSTLARWKQQPISFIEEILLDPETEQPFEIFPAQREFFEHCWQRDDHGRALYPEQCFGAIKKSAKTGTAALHVLTTTCLYGGRFAEAYCCANDLEQAQSRVFQQVRRIVECSPHLQRDADITQSRITFPQTGAVIQALGGDAPGAAGGHPVISSFDELWGYTSERARRLWDEMVPVPTRQFSVRLVTTYAGFGGESVLLGELHKRGMALPLVGDSLHAGDGLLMAWHTKPICEWQTEAWLAEMRRSLRPNQYLRMIENQFVTTESSFIPMAVWDRIVDRRLTPIEADKNLAVFIGVDASMMHDQTAIVVTTYDSQAQMVRLVCHYVFQPSPDEPLDFETTVEATLLDLDRSFHVVKVLFDPFQMQATSQRLMRAGLPIEPFKQSSPNLTAASQNLYDLIQGQNLVVYPDADMRLAISRAVATDTPRGWKISKTTASHKIDVIVALSMSAYAAVQSQGESTPYILDAFVDGFTEEPPDEVTQECQRYREQLLQQYGQPGRLFSFGPDGKVKA